MSTTVAPDRRLRRRLETIEEVLDLSVEIMAEQGVAGLALGEIARRMGIRPPSLYVYFPSKNALYDALFRRGADEVLAVAEKERALPADGLSLTEQLLRAGRAFVGWCVTHPAYSQLLFWRPVPGFTPSAEAYAPAVRMVALGREWFADLQAQGLLRPDVDLDLALRDWTVLTSGVVSQQLANAPDEPATAGRFTAALPDLTAMFADYYGTTQPTPARGRARHADRR